MIRKLVSTPVDAWTSHQIFTCTSRSAPRAEHISRYRIDRYWTPELKRANSTTCPTTSSAGILVFNSFTCCLRPTHCVLHSSDSQTSLSNSLQAPSSLFISSRQTSFMSSLPTLPGLSYPHLFLHFQATSLGLPDHPAPFELPQSLDVLCTHFKSCLEAVTAVVVAVEDHLAG